MSQFKLAKAIARVTEASSRYVSYLEGVENHAPVPNSIWGNPTIPIPSSVTARILYRQKFSTPVSVMTLGWNRMYEGKVEGDLDYDSDGNMEGRHLVPMKSHAVIMCQRIRNGRWTKPFPVLPEDLIYE